MALVKDYTLELFYENERLRVDKVFKQLIQDSEQTITLTKTIPNAYIVVEKLEGDKNLISFTLSIYANSNKEYAIENKRYSFIPDVSTSTTPNYHVQAYEYLKTLPEFDGAIDVLEEGQVAV